MFGDQISTIVLPLVAVLTLHVGPAQMGYLAGLVAYSTIIDLSGRPRWRTALWLALAIWRTATVGSLQFAVLLFFGLLNLATVGRVIFPGGQTA